MLCEVSAVRILSGKAFHQHEINVGLVDKQRYLTDSDGRLVLDGRNRKIKIDPPPVSGITHSTKSGPVTRHNIANQRAEDINKAFEIMLRFHDKGNQLKDALVSKFVFENTDEEGAKQNGIERTAYKRRITLGVNWMHGHLKRKST